MTLPKRKNRYQKQNQITQLAALINDIGGRLGNLAAGLVCMEAIIEDAGIMTQERLERIKPIVRKKLGLPDPVPPPSEECAAKAIREAALGPETAAALEEIEPSQCCEHDNVAERPQTGMSPIADKPTCCEWHESGGTGSVCRV